MMKTVEEKSSDKVVEATVAEPVKAAKKTRIAMAGAKKGAAAAKRAAAKVVTAPGRLLDKTVYNVCYGISYSAVFTSLRGEKALPADGAAMKGFHEGAEIARKDFETHQEKHLSPNDPSVVN